MSTLKSRRKGQDKNRKGRLEEKAFSFHGRSTEEMVGKLSRPRTLPNLLPGKSAVGISPETASSFQGRSAEEMVGKLLRPRTVHDLLPSKSAAGISPETRPKLTKLLLNVTIQRSLGAVQVLMSPESTVGDLIAAALRQYSKEGRRLIFPSLDPSGFDLHYSQFSLQSLETKEVLIGLGSRNFFLCPKKAATESGSGGDSGATASASASASASSSCSKQADKATKSGMGWLMFMGFLL